MKRLVFVLTFSSLVMLSFATCYGASEIVLDRVTSLYSGDTVLGGCSVEFTFRLTNADGNTIVGFVNGFRVWTYRYGAYTDNFDPIAYDTLPIGWDTIYDGGFFLNPFSVDGAGEDTIGFNGFKIFGSGIPDGFDQPVWWVRTRPYADGDTLCIDSSWYPPAGEWLWSTIPAGTIYPDWHGPYCFLVYLCPCGPPEFTNCVPSLAFAHCATAQYTFCAEDLINPPGYPFTFKLLSGPGMINQISDTCAEWSYTPSVDDVGTSQSITVEVRSDFNCAQCTVDLIFTNCQNRGNVDGVDGINVADLTYLVDYLFLAGPPPPCEEEGNVDGDGGINVADVTYLVDYLFRGGPAPPPCP